jgi:hypothetical protein
MEGLFYSADLESLKIAIPGRTGIRNHIPDIGHACNILNKTFKSKTEPGMGNSSIFSQIQIPPVILRIQALFLDSVQKQVVPVFSFAAADARSIPQETGYSKETEEAFRSSMAFV